jgi:iron complex transport system substrate-binding protein
MKVSRALLLLICSVAGPAYAVAPRIVSLAPNLTELAFSAGAGAQIIATVEYSDYPEAAKAIPRIGDAFRVDLERLVALHPDVVLAWQTGTPTALIERAGKLHLNIQVLPAGTFADIASSIRKIGQLAGTSKTAERAAKDFEDQIAKLRATYSNRPSLRVFVEVNAQPLYTVNGRHVISEVLALCGGQNVFASLGDISPVVGIEAVAAAHPQVILAAADDSAESADTRWARWGFVEAARTGNVYSIESGLLVRASPRLAAGAERVCAALDEVRHKASGNY